MLRPAILLTHPVEPEIKSFAIVRAPGGYALRTILSRGEAVLSYDDTQADTSQAIIGRVMREMVRESEK
jgi:hypothetical protein